ncbi:MAG: hydroxyacylglutathione hydrolase [Deltaproteobacteria bacterium]|nr:hydroxyacylglutathione hydrolase [Deltaproteobacteria bacterium]
MSEPKHGARVLVVPCLADNYAYLVVGDRGRAVVVDPSEAAPVERALETAGLELAAVLCTHHHWDHVGGLAELRARRGVLEVYAHAIDAARIDGAVHELGDDEPLCVAGLDFAALHVPGHTLGAVAWFGAGAVFTGDTLFLAGCGRLFEGPAAMMRASLERLAALDGDTRVYCGHEYTVANLRFAATVEPENHAVAARLERALAARASGRATVPATLAEERATNPFLRCDEPEIRRRFAGATLDEVFAEVRAAKDRFK